MSEEKEIAVQIEPEDEEEVVVATEAKPEEKKDEKDAVSELKAQYDEIQKTAEEAKRATEAAERRAQEAIQAADAARREAAAARTEVSDSQLESITSGLGAAEAEASNAEAEYAAAMEKADYAAAAKAQRKLAGAEARLLRLDEAKKDLEARKLEAPRQPEYTDKFEQSISNLTDPSKRWLRDHKEWATDPKKNARLTAAHYDAVANDVPVDSSEYFEFVEKKIGLRKDPEKVEVAAHQRRKTAPPVAPVNGGGGGGTNVSDDGAVTLSAREAKAATDGTLKWNYDDPSGQKRFKKGDPLGIQEFARRKREGMKQGLYDKSKME